MARLGKDTFGVFRAGQLFLVPMETESVVYALKENPAGMILFFENQYLLNSGFGRCGGRGKSR